MSVFQDKTQTPLSAATGAITSGDTSSVGAPGGLVPVTYNGGAGAYTLQAPIPGPPVPPSASGAQYGSTSSALGGQTHQGGDDGKVLKILLTTAQVVVITVGTSGHGYVNGSKNVITFTGVIGNSITLEAYGGVWYVLGNIGGTLSGS
jgi:hypothetical protein